MTERDAAIAAATVSPMGPDFVAFFSSVVSKKATYGRSRDLCEPEAYGNQKKHVIYTLCGYANTQ
jgi:hypothetical protein